jgi:hypothetical protein
VAKTMLGINEACQRYHVSPATLRRAIKRASFGELRGAKRNRQRCLENSNSSLKPFINPAKGLRPKKRINKAENLPKINEKSAKILPL